MRKAIIAGNWKMNNTIEDSLKMVKNLKDYDLDDSVEAVLCVPFLDLLPVKEELKESNVKLGAQNMHWAESGAYTGEVSPLMLKEIGVEYVIIGHSERREYFNETDEMINKKMHSAIKHDLKPILCVGETLDEKDEGIAEKTVWSQISKGLAEIAAEDLESVVVAYEPIWAIGTGKTASADEANEMIAYIRQVISNLYSEKIGQAIRIQYGGSVKPENIAELMSKEEIDGALVGGASLVAEDFAELINY